MSDIDFDELDRAVNGAIGSPASSGEAINVTRPQVNAPIEAPVVEAPTIERVERTTMNPTSETATPSAPAARRSSGRFMDMVHPSSDMRLNNTSAPAASRPIETPSVQPVEKQLEEVAETPLWNEPLESPFLSDAKVEKRPLGGVPSVENFDFQGLLDEPEEVLLEAPEPQELLEATNMLDPIDFAAITPEVEAVEDIEVPVVNEIPHVDENTPEQPLVVEEVAQPIVEEPIGPTSITPQYKEQLSSNQESGAIFDTESYHQAVTPPLKKKSGWITLVWIIVLIALGAAAGWAVYTYVLPML